MHAIRHISKLNRLHRITKAAALCGLLASGAAQAHQVWLEQDGQGAKLYFGEFGENLKYDRANYVTSLTLMQKTGLPALPATPAAAPNK